MAAYTPLLDRRYKVLGTYSGGTGLTTWALPLGDASINLMILGPSFANPGAVYVETGGFTLDVANSRATKSGDYTAGYVIFGTAYDMDVELTTPYPKTKDNNDNYTAHRQIRHVDLTYSQSGPFTITSVWENNSHLGKSVSPASSTAIDNATATSKLRARINGNADQMSLHITSSDPKRVNIASAFFEIDSNTRRDN